MTSTRNDLPTEIFYAVTEKLPTEDRYYNKWRLRRLYTTLAHAKMFLYEHPKRKRRLYKATVVWEEVPFEPVPRDSQ